MAQPQYITGGKFTGSGNYAGTPQSLASAIDTTGATEIYIFVVVYNTTAPTAVTDTKGNTYTQQGTGIAMNSAPGLLFCFRATGVTAGSGHNFSVTPAGNFGLTFLVVAVGPSAGGSLTSTTWATTSDASSPHTSGAVSVPSGGALLISAGAHDSSTTPFVYDWSGSGFTERQSEKTSGNWTCSAATKVVASAGSNTAAFASTGTVSNAGIGIIMITESAIGPALTSPTPSGTLGTQTTATVGATTDQTTGTLYVVVDSAANLSGVTATQIKAGQKASGASALAAANSAVSTTTPSAGVTGLSASTLYSYAAVQNNANGDSNIVTGTFTTASASVPTISGLSTLVPNNGQTGVVISGALFEASQGSGKVYLSPTNNVADGGRVEQTATAWADGSITFTVVKGSLSFETNVYLFVVNNSANSNATGTVLQIVARPYVRDTLVNETGATVNSETGMTMLVWHAAPSTGSPNPNQAIGSVSTSGAGALDQIINRGSLALDAPVWIALLKDGSPAKGTLRKVTPVYE